MSFLLNIHYGKNWIYVILRLSMIVALSVLIYIMQPRVITDFNSIRDIVIPAGIGVLSLGLVAATILVSGLKRYVIPAVIIADLILVGSYLYFTLSYDRLLLTMIVTSIVISGILRVGLIGGIIELVGLGMVMVFVAYRTPTADVNVLIDNFDLYWPPLLFVGVIGVAASLWSYVLDDENNLSRRRVRREIEETRMRLDDMRERTRAIADMAATLNTTLNYDRILDAALDIGRLSVRHDPKERIVSMAIMVTEDDSMEIASARGLQHIDMQQRFTGYTGIIAKTIEAGEPIIHAGGAEDPELGVLNAFANIQTTLCIPLRASFETYGVLVFGSTMADAINGDHVDTLAAIGVQAAVALQNAVLYHNLREEKERILRIEENGRKALVRDLHDIPTQTVSAVAMHLSTLPTIAERYPERLKPEVDNIRGMALRATEEIRHVMFTLRPLSLESSGIVTALEQLAEKMERTYGQPMQVKIDSKIEAFLKQEVQGTLFYLIEEAANNARKYAKASMIQVQGGVQRNEVVIRIRDNGKGFDTDQVTTNYEDRGSFGMVNMRERAELINGVFELASAPGKGTTVTVRVPLQDENLSSGKPRIMPRKPLRKQYSGPLSPSK